MIQKDNKIAQLERSLNSGGNSVKLQRQVDNMYSFDRFHINFNCDVDAYLLSPKVNS